MIKLALNKIEANVDTMKSKLARKEDYDVLNWITPDDYGPLQSDHFRRRQAGTGEWLLNSMEFQKWLKTSQETLFCHGIPGAGKTILTSIVINHLTRRSCEDQSLGIAYVYCNYQRKDEQTVDRLLSSLLKQLSEKLPTIPGEVSGLYNQHKTDRTRPSLEEISRTIHSVAVKYSRVFILVDALDECRESENCRIRFLSEIFSLQARCGINVFATSRMNGEIEKLFTNGITLEIRARDHDIDIYLDERMRLQQLDILDGDTKNEIKRTVVDATGGMYGIQLTPKTIRIVLKPNISFLLAKLHIESLMTLPTRGHIKDALRNLAKGDEALDKTYSQTMERIDDHPKERRYLARQILGWAFYARRPLSILELRYALAVKTQSAKLDKDYIPSTKLIRSLCLGLVTIDKGSAMVRLVHYTTQEYFRRTQSRWFPSAELEIVQTCITILSFDRFKNGFCPNDAELNARIRYLLYHYSARNWGHHAREASIRAEQLILSLFTGATKVSSLSEDGSTHLTSAHLAAYLVQRNRVLEFLNSDSNISGSSQAMLVNEGYDQSPNYSQDVPRQMTSIHLAAYFGLSDIVGILLRNGHDPNTGDSYKRTPLSWAAENGHKEVVCLLLEMAGVDPDAKAESGRTPLSWAAWQGHAAVVTMLLEKHSVDPNSKDWRTRQTPLSLAALRGHGMVVWLLLGDERVEPDSRSESGQTPLSYAAENGHETVVLLLLANDRIDPDSRSIFGRSRRWARGRSPYLAHK
jgi:ankyrin repeat protein